MPSWYEVFDNVDVQLMTRRQAAKLSALSLTMVAVSLTALSFAYAGHLSMQGIGMALLVTWAVAIWWIMQRLRYLRRIVWCIKLSDREVVGYDYARRKSRVDWLDVDRVEINSESLQVVGSPSTALEVSHLFPDFAVLSHRIIHYADLYDIPVYVEGQPWQQLDVYNLYPFLVDGSSSDAARGSTRA